ncbi:TetR/AcrR family transcriptional regulator [Allokutzneria oryzae]|uniref:TetR/AcrR family transcriptional regulator n=1 Tax=Allokutzneria oryzae TaxID=1378989 RepID=A0ABV5ZRU5_9PSEU
MGLRETKMERTRQLIADKAFELFTAQGFATTTMEQIAAAAEVGPRTLYRYYATKESLLLTFVEQKLDAALDVLRAQPEDVPLPEALYKLVDYVLRTVAESGDRIIAVYELAWRTPSARAQLSDKTSHWRRELATEISRRMGGRSAELAAALASANTMTVIEVSIHNWVSSGGRANMRRLTHRALDLLREGAVPVPTPRARSAT